MVLTFSPHPVTALGRPAPALLTTNERKVELIRRVDPSIDVLVQPFDAAFAAQTPEEFAEDVLARRLHAKHVVVGHNFRFGAGRVGDPAELTRLGAALGFETRTHPLVGDEQGAWSSTRVRAAIAAGDLEGAERMLGRPHMISGVVVRGDQRGRTIGFPTCNVASIEEALPPFGVYAVLVDQVGARGARALARGAANLGVRPTITPGETRPSVEVHLFDIDQDLYGARLRVHLMKRLRAERRFDGLDALKAQIARDAADARAALDPLAPDPGAGGGWR
jgi:riboflavin kinase/FMN adenylyltransferase